MSKLIKIDTKVLHKKSLISNLTYFLSINHLFLLQLNQNIFFFFFSEIKKIKSYNKIKNNKKAYELNKRATIPKKLITKNL